MSKNCGINISHTNMIPEQKKLNYFEYRPILQVQQSVENFKNKRKCQNKQEARKDIHTLLAHQLFKVVQKLHKIKL